jgi:hypothetical protein
MQAINLNIKEEFKSTVVGFGTSGLPLGERSQDDLVALAEMSAYDGYSAKFFEELPTAEQIQAYKENKLIQQTEPVAEEPAKPTAVEITPVVNEEQEAPEQTTEHIDQ